MHKKHKKGKKEKIQQVYKLTRAHVQKKSLIVNTTAGTGGTQ